MNTILYNSNEGIKDEVNKRPRNTSPPTSAATIAATKPSMNDNVSAIVYTTSNAVLDQKIDLITEGMNLFIVSNLREITEDNALTIAKYILSMKNEINLSDNYRRLNIYALYRISKFFNNRNHTKSWQEMICCSFLIVSESLKHLILSING